MNLAFWGILLVGVTFSVSTLLCILSITNAMSGHDNVMTDMTPFLTVFPLSILVFCIAFSLYTSKLSESPNTRKSILFMFVCVAYIFSMLTLHLSSFIIKMVYT